MSKHPFVSSRADIKPDWSLARWGQEGYMAAQYTGKIPDVWRHQMTEAEFEAWHEGYNKCNQEAKERFNEWKSENW